MLPGVLFIAIRLLVIMATCFMSGHNEESMNPLQQTQLSGIPSSEKTLSRGNVRPDDCNPLVIASFFFLAVLLVPHTSEAAGPNQSKC
jgi:hypothetical protein